MDTQAPAPAPSATSSSGGKPSLGKKLWLKLKAHPVGKLLSAVGGVLFGMSVQAAVQTTGVLGPDMGALIEQQTSGFERIDAKLEALRQTSDPQQAQTLAKDLEVLVANQRQLNERAADELRGARAEIDRLKEAALEASASSGGADLWLRPGESATIGEAGNVFSLLAYLGGNSQDISTNANGSKLRMAVGDWAPFPGENGGYTVYFKQGERRPDERIGFDVVQGTPAKPDPGP